MGCTYMNLGTRLEGAVSLLSEAENKQTFADIGSDHAFLAIEMVKRGIAQNGIAADINKMPLEKGKENASSQGIEIEFVLSDGFDGLENKGLTFAAVCGMGGELIAKMVLRSRITRQCLLVLQPMSAQEELRKALWDNGFCIIKELFAVEGGKPYTLMQVKYDGVKREYDYIDLYLGKERKETAEFLQYREKIKAAAIKRRLGYIAENKDTCEIDKLIGIE